MFLRKAVEILSDSANRGLTTLNQDFKDAQRLGAEALIRISNMRINPGENAERLLPNETEGGEDE